MREFTLEENERLIGIRSYTRNREAEHFSVQFIVGSKEAIRYRPHLVNQTND